jgi:hypothetical protein
MNTQEFGEIIKTFLKTKKEFEEAEAKCEGAAHVVVSAFEDNEFTENFLITHDG